MYFTVAFSSRLKIHSYYNLIIENQELDMVPSFSKMLLQGNRVTDKVDSVYNFKLLESLLYYRKCES